MPDAMNLDGVTMFVSATADNGVVDESTRLVFGQRAGRVLARYQGGAVRRGCLVGVRRGANLECRYVQVEASGEIHGGRSTCAIDRTDDGRLRVVERFNWSTREGGGINMFEELRRLPQ